MYCLSFYRVTDDTTRTEKRLVAAAWLNNDSLWEYRTAWMFMSVPRTVAVWSLCGVDEVPGAHFHQRLLLAGPIGDCCREFPSAKTQWKIGFKLSEWLLNHKIYGTLLRLVVCFSPVNISQFCVHSAKMWLHKSL